MRVLVQRVKKASVTVEGQLVSQIGLGTLLLVGVLHDDGDQDMVWMIKKLVNLRIFEDENGKTNLSLQQVQGEVLSVPQFTLCADMKKGNRPGFDQAAKPEPAKAFWLRLNEGLKANGLPVKEGVFGAHMDVELLNDGPFSIWLDSRSDS